MQRRTMADVALLRRDVAAFAEHVGRPLSERQAADLHLRSRFTSLLAARQTGKSRSLAILGTHWAFARPRQHVLIVSAGESAAKRLLDEMRQMMLDSSDLASSVVKENTDLIELTNGSRIRSLPASDKQIRGNTVDLLLIDEAQLVPTAILVSAALPTVAARPNARIVLAGTAGRASGAFYNATERGDRNDDAYTTIRWRVEDCAWIEPEFVATMRASMSAAQFAAEFEGRFWSGSDSLFTKAILDRVVAPFRAGTLGTLVGPARLSGGVDWGATVDRSALCAIGRLPFVEHDLPVFGVALAHRWAAGYPLNDVIGEIAACQAHWAVLSIETNGLGLPCAQELAGRMRRRDATAGGRVGRWRPPAYDQYDAFGNYRAPDQGAPTFRTTINAQHTSADLKAAVYSQLRLLIDRQQLVISADDTDLLRELLFLQVSLNAGGSQKIEADASAEEGTGHDDLADAAAFAMGPHRRDGRWTTVLARYADPAARQPPALPLPGGDLPRVATGGGLLVPRTPVWQSLGGSELTGSEALRPAPRRVGDFIINTNPGAQHAQ